MHWKGYKYPIQLDNKEVDNILKRYDFSKIENKWFSSDKNTIIENLGKDYYIKICGLVHYSRLPNDCYTFEVKIKNILDLLNTGVISRLEETTNRYIEAEIFILNLNFFQKLFFLRKYNKFVKNIINNYKY
jgi:hypothetical protein